MHLARMRGHITVQLTSCLTDSITLLTSYFEINNRFTCLIESKLVKPETHLHCTAVWSLNPNQSNRRSAVQ